MSSLGTRASVAMRTAARKMLRTRILILLALVLALIPAGILAYIENIYDFRDKDAQRGAATAPQEIFGDHYERVAYLKQGWDEAESIWFYTTTQGSDLIPYDFFLELDAAGTGQRFLSDDNVRRWRYLPQRATPRNPDALPVGFVKDTYKGRDYVGFSCAACHSGQVNYKGTAIRIDGGPAMADMDTFMHELAAAINATTQLDDKGQCSAKACTDFVERVLKRGNYRNAAAVTEDLAKYRLRIAAYTQINESKHSTKGGSETSVPYGYARLDAFGRIYNRVLEHLIQKPQLASLLEEVYTPAELPAVQVALKPIFVSDQADHVIERALPLLDDAQRKKLIAKLFNSPNAPVSYPFLWDIAQHDYVQWNGLAANEGLGPVGRNAGEVIGVFGTLEWKVEDGFSWRNLVPNIITGQSIGEQHISFESSVNVHNLRRLESRLRRLQSPQWPTEILGTPDADRAARGAIHFETHCASCHANILRDNPERRVVANMTRLEAIKTDPMMAANSVSYSGYSGILRNQYVSTGSVGDILLDKKAPVAALLTKATTGVVATPYPKNIFQRGWDWLIDLGTAFFSNDIKPSIKHGDYNPDTTAKPYDSLLAYKGRSLNGIWATAPYMHNGSVPTLYDLLLPKRLAGDPANEDYRPDSFIVGSREYDPVKGGYVSEGYKGFVFDTTQPTNSNAGHEYGTIHDTSLPKRGLKPLTKDERMDLLEYMKTL